MFCDLVGSTALSAKLDPEDLHGVIGAYHRCCAELVERNGGFVAKYMGDGVLAYFGYPEAHEDDAERAVRAGLAVVEAGPKLVTAAGSPLQVRIGIATGLVVVGDLVGSGEAQERGVVGETPNLAARLQGIAEPDEVVLADGTRRLLGDIFELRDLGLKDLKGVAKPVRAWAALRESRVESRFEALHPSGLTALVGREEECELLLRRWSRAKAGEGQIVLLSGEPGIGKSRLTAELEERFRDEPHLRLRYFCSLQHRDSALYPFIARIERAAGFEREDDAAGRLDKLETALAKSGEVNAERAALFADLLGLAPEDRYPAPPGDPQQRRERTLAALLDELATLSRQRPALLIFEDAHWADSTSLELLDRMIELAPRLPVLMIVTFRPEFSAPWMGQAHVTSLSLNRLARREMAALVQSVTGGKSLPPEILDRVIQHTDGVPLFIEELTKSLLEGGLLREEAGGYALAIPSSLQDALMARLDRLSGAKQVAQTAAVIGREFSYELLRAVTSISDDELCSALRRLAELRADLPARRPAASPLYVQARADSGRRVPLAAQSQSEPPASPGGRSAGDAVSRDGRETARTHRLPLHRGWPRRARHRLLAKGRPAGGEARGQYRGDRSFAPWLGDAGKLTRSRGARRRGADLVARARAGPDVDENDRGAGDTTGLTIARFASRAISARWRNCSQPCGDPG